MMTPSSTLSSQWREANQQVLMAAVARVRELIAGHGRADRADRAVQMVDGAAALNESARGMATPPAVDIVAQAFGLSSFERDVLLLCAGMELDSSFAALCAEAQGSPRQPHPTFSLALAALPGAHWSALTPDAPLRHWRLIEMGQGPTLTASPLRIDERVLHFLTGTATFDERLSALTQPVAAPESLPPSYEALAASMAQALERSQHQPPRPILTVAGVDAAARQDVVADACGRFGIALYALHAAELPVQSAEHLDLIRLWEREAVLSGSALLVECGDETSPELLRAVAAFVDHSQGLLALSSREPLLVTHQRPALPFRLKPLDRGEQQAAWEAALHPLGQALNGSLDGVIAQFNLGPRGIRAASADALGRLAASGDALGRLAASGDLRPENVRRALWEACRAQARPRLEQLAQRIDPAATWDDLVLPEAQIRILHDIVAQVRQRRTVYDTWGFAAKSARGLGISALFAGVSGTGKTMAAEVLANALQLDLYRIDLSAVVSKYIGETEKNLRRLFDAAEQSGQILFFDEADALFGKRSEVKDSHDRYANIEVSYLLQRMEAYNGLAILTTNMKDALDAAFLRRIRFVVQFPFPSAEHRAAIWCRIFPPDTPTERLDYVRLARLNVAGGNIRNIALGAAFLAADAGQPVRMEHVLRAAQTEYAKLEKSLTDGEIRGWVESHAD